MTGLAFASIRGETVMAVLVCTAVAAVVWWIRERRLSEERRSVRFLYSLTEAVLSARSPAEIAERLRAARANHAFPTSFQLYLYDRDAGRLVRAGVVADEPRSAIAADMDDPLLQCYRSGEITVVTEFQDAGEGGGRPGLLVPIDAEERAEGVLAIVYPEGPRRFGEDQRAAALHLARHIGFVLRRLQQQVVREQLTRGENVGNASRLLASAFGELRKPLIALALHAEAFPRAVGVGAAGPELSSLASEARACLTLLDRLASAVGDEGGRDMEFRSFVSSLLESHRRQWSDAGLDIEAEIDPETLPIYGSPSQLGEAIQAIVTEAMPRAGDERPRKAGLSVRRAGERAVLSIGYSSPYGDETLSVEHPSSVVARSIVETHGGHLRRISTGGTATVVELELPLADDRSSPGDSNEQPEDNSPLTLLVAVPEDADRRWLVCALARRGHRVVPVNDPNEAMEVVQRLSFDALFCPEIAAGDPAAETLAKAAHFVPGLILLTDSTPSAPPTTSGSLRISTLRRPFDERQLDNALAYLRRPAGEA